MRSRSHTPLTPNASRLTEGRPGTLYLVATPIGNLEDLTFRALRILKEVDLVAAEDTRHSRKLFSHFGITTPLTAYHEHNEDRKTAELLKAMGEGRSVALISDAGTPAIADPGYRLVRACREAGIPVAAVPGPAAVTAALSVAGLPTDRFAFEGFLPARAKARSDRLQALKAEERTLVFYEAPHRLTATLREMVEVFGAGREIAVARELTKVHEEVARGSAQEVLAHFIGEKKVRGEIVLLVAPGREEAPQRPLAEVLRERLAAGDRPAREVVKEVAREFGLPGSEVYQEWLAIKAEEEKKR